MNVFTCVSVLLKRNLVQFIFVSDSTVLSDSPSMGVFVIRSLVVQLSISPVLPKVSDNCYHLYTLVIIISVFLLIGYKWSSFLILHMQSLDHSSMQAA